MNLAVNMTIPKKLWKIYFINISPVTSPPYLLQCSQIKKDLEMCKTGKKIPALVLLKQTEPLGLTYFTI